MKVAVLIVLGLFISITSFAEEIEFFWGPESLSKLSVKDLRKGTLDLEGKKLSAIQEKVYNPFRKYTKSYEGYDLLSLLDQVYGPRWRDAESITFTALDGFVQVAPIKKMLEKSNEHVGILAFKEDKIEGFSSFEKNGKQVNPGPLYLVWSRFDGRTVANYSDFLKWPYQLKSIKILKISK